MHENGLFAPELPATAYVRLWDFLGPGKAIPHSKSWLYQAIADGKFEPPRKIGARTSVWRVGYIRSVLAAIERGEYPS